MRQSLANQIRVTCRSRFQKFKDVRSRRRSFGGLEERGSKKKLEKEKLLGDIEIEEMGVKGKRPLWMSGVEEIKLDASEIQSKSEPRKVAS